MATSTSWAQDVIICDLCDNPAVRFCNSCQTNLCLDCVDTHLNEFESLSHDIVTFQHRMIHLVLPECKFHPGQRCEDHCQNCHTPVCVNCFARNHKGHDIVGLAKIVEQKKEILKREIQETEGNILPKYKARGVSIKAQIFKVNADSVKMKTDLEELRKIWHQEVNAIFENANDLVNSTKYSKIKSLTNLQIHLQKKLSKVKQDLYNQKKILTSNDAYRVKNFKSKLGELKDIPKDCDVQFPVLTVNTERGRELQLKINEFEAILSHKPPVRLVDEASYHSTKKLLDNVKVISTISVVCSDLRNVVCVGTDTAWISGIDKSITCVDIQGSLKETVATTVNWPKFALIRQGKLLYCDYFSKTVKIIKQGRIETYISSPQGWIPWTLCCTKSEDVLLHVSKNDENKLIRYQGHKLTQEIDKDSRGRSIFKTGVLSLLMTDNRNGDICVCDRNARTVTVVDIVGRVRFQYDGTPARIKKSFDPIDVVTDSLSQIILSDHVNDCLHVLDQNGEFLKCVDNCGIVNPWGLSIDIEERLWVAMTKGNVIKVIKYLE